MALRADVGDSSSWREVTIVYGSVPERIIKAGRSAHTWVLGALCRSSSPHINASAGQDTFSMRRSPVASEARFTQVLSNPMMDKWWNSSYASFHDHSQISIQTKLEPWFRTLNDAKSWISDFLVSSEMGPGITWPLRWYPHEVSPKCLRCDYSVLLYSIYPQEPFKNT